VVVLRAIGWLLILAALALLGRDVYAWVKSGHWAATLTGKLWDQVSPNSLGLLQATIEHHVWRPLWSNGISPLLLQPVWLVLGVAGIVVVALFRRSRKRRLFGR
jgi:hypothetical protein